LDILDDADGSGLAYGDDETRLSKSYHFEELGGTSQLGCVWCGLVGSRSTRDQISNCPAIGWVHYVVEETIVEDLIDAVTVDVWSSGNEEDLGWQVSSKEHDLSSTVTLLTGLAVTPL
jgi:hypothetical protein